MSAATLAPVLAPAPVPAPSVFRPGPTRFPKPGPRRPAARPASPAPRPANPAPSTMPAGRVRTGPAWVIVDYENLAGTGDPGHGLIRSTWESLRRLLVPGDKVVIATGALCGSPVRYCLAKTGARFLTRSGKNGAENALIENTDLSEIAKSYRWLVIASGDGRLTALADEAAALGMSTWQITGIGRCHPSLEAAVTVHSQLRITVPGRHLEPRPA